MLGWMFKKAETVAPAPKAGGAPEVPAAAATPTVPAVDWAAALAQAQGDEDALLALLQRPGLPLVHKLAVVESLASEAALKRAERECRKHDRRVHQLAKRRLQAQQHQRQTRERAAQLIEGLQALAGQADAPVNHAVEIDRAWQALDASVLEPAQRDAFAALSAQLSTQARDRAERQVQHRQWQAGAALALQQLPLACREAAAGTQDRAALAQAVAATREWVRSAPSPDAAAPARDTTLAALQQALDTAALLDQHLAALERLLAVPAGGHAGADPAGSDAAGPGAACDASAVDASAVDEAAVARESTDAKTVAGGTGTDETGADRVGARDSDAAEALQAWQALAPLPDPALATALQARHARWLDDREQARQVRRTARREQARAGQRTQRAEHQAALADSLAKVEAALEDGHLADAQRLLGAIDDEARATDASDALRARLAAAQARLAQLRGWQQWAGGRARDDLVQQAEALAAAESPRLSIQQRAELIDTLRARWKEIDHLGGGSSRALWQRFDAALKTAYEPVAHHVQAQRAAREANLALRCQLLDALEAAAAGLTSPGDATDAGHASAAEPTPAPSPAVPGAPPVGIARLAAALDHFQLEWRKLGPLEHTVPKGQRAALAERLQAAVRRVEQPLQAARRQARSQREALVERARALAATADARGLGAEVRELQAQWQRHAKALPLGRGDEQALWTAFKTAIEAAFAAREASFQAREAELEGHAAEREALIARLQPRDNASPAALRRLLAEVDAAWQRCPPPPRSRAAALEAAYHGARETLRQWLDQSGQREWQARCDALEAKLALCLARERTDAGVPDGAATNGRAGAATDAAMDAPRGAATDRAGDAQREAAALAAAWQALPALPAVLEDALRRRAGLLRPAGRDEPAPDVDELLLQLELAWALPTPPAFEAARRERKLLAMKAALEGRRGSPAELPAEAALAALLRCSGLNAGQRDRLAAVLAAWRRRGPQRA